MSAYCRCQGHVTGLDEQYPRDPQDWMRSFLLLLVKLQEDGYSLRNKSYASSVAKRTKSRHRVSHSFWSW